MFGSLPKETKQNAKHTLPHTQCFKKPCFLLISAFCFITPNVLQTQSGACQMTDGLFSEVISWTFLAEKLLLFFKQKQNKNKYTSGYCWQRRTGYLFLSSLSEKSFILSLFFWSRTRLFDPSLLRKPLNGWQRLSTGSSTYLPDTETNSLTIVRPSSLAARFNAEP